MIKVIGFLSLVWHIGGWYDWYKRCPLSDDKLNNNAQMWKTPVGHITEHLCTYKVQEDTTPWGQLAIGRVTRNVPLEILYLPLSQAAYLGRRRRVIDSPLPHGHSSLLPSFSSLQITKETCSPWQRVNSATAPASVYDRSLCPHIGLYRRPVCNTFLS